MERDVDVDVKSAWTREKCNRVHPFDQVVFDAPPHSLPTLATSNYFAELPTMKVELEEGQPVADSEYGHRILLFT